MESTEELLYAECDYGPLTQRQAENIADLAARRAQERIYAEIGRSVVAKTLYTIGALTAVGAAWLSGWFHLGPK